MLIKNVLSTLVSFNFTAGVLLVDIWSIAYDEIDAFPFSYIHHVPMQILEFRCFWIYDNRIIIFLTSHPFHYFKICCAPLFGRCIFHAQPIQAMKVFQFQKNILARSTYAHDRAIEFSNVLISYLHTESIFGCFNSLYEVFMFVRNLINMISTFREASLPSPSNTHVIKPDGGGLTRSKMKWGWICFLLISLAYSYIGPRVIHLPRGVHNEWVELISSFQIGRDRGNKIIRSTLQFCLLRTNNAKCNFQQCGYQFQKFVLKLCIHTEATKCECQIYGAAFEHRYRIDEHNRRINPQR